MKIDTKDLSGPQSFLISLMERFQKAEAETDINKAVASYDAKKYGPRFGLPAYCHTTTTQSAKDCLRPAKNKKGRDVALICYLQENADHTVRYVPVARMIDPLCRANYVIEEIPAKAA